MAESKGAGGARPIYPAGTIAKVSTDILNETFHNIIHDLVSKVHREEKIARMRSAVTVARQKAEATVDVSDENGVDPKKEEVVEQKNVADLQLETEGAIFDRGKVFLKGNPLHTTKQIICPECRLPRLLYPPTGSNAVPPPDPHAEYCQNQPLVTVPGHDVHGKLFSVMPNPKKKKEDDTIPTVPTNKCPICPRYFVISRLAQHMDRCMNISGRGSARNQTPTDSSAGAGSGASSPTSSASKRAHADDEDGSPSPTKKKKLNAPKKNATTKPGPSKLKNSFTVEDNDDDLNSENADTVDI
ncbi:hypothetical protein N7510_005323 [Penicillium lagena]|uniref:uncharacterized protein n=1 Tax=Penicillium lagena TaxID=94218 RepID=UPI002541F380|nr:uncharacterized protein N7510_005323 [Penicillium lagena]KAJ5612129.1 hypothetical protein N7510_005323 [Penicillium lagena]